MDKTKNLTSGNVLGTLISFAVPVFAALFLQSLYGGVDLLVVGQFATTADVSGVATGSLIVQTITMVITGLSMGVTIYVGRKIGKGQSEAAGKAIGAAIALFAVAAVIVTLIMAGFTNLLADALHTPDEAYTQTCQYIRICGIGMIFVVMYNLVGAVFRGIGDAKTPLVTVCIACIVNIVADLVFVAVLGLGSAGAAIATIMAQAVSVICSIAVIMKKELPFDFSRKFIRFDMCYISKELKLGTPIALQELLVGISFVVIQTVVNSIDVVASAGVGVAEKVCAFIMLVPSAFSQSMSAFVAQNMGAGEEKRAVLALKYGILSSLCVALFIGSFTFFRGDLLAMIFSKDTAVIAQAHQYLKAYAVDTFFTSFMFCFVGYYNGCGNTMFVMIQGIIGALMVRVPVVLIVSRIPDVTLFQIGLATPASTFVQIVLCLIFYRYIKTKQQKLQ